MLIWIILSSAFVAVFLFIRALFSKKITASAMYVLWILVAVRLLIPTYIPVEWNLFPAQNIPSITYQVEAVEDQVTEYFAESEVLTEGETNPTIPVTPSDAIDQSVTDNLDTTIQNNTNSTSVVLNTNKVTNNITNHPFLSVWMLGILGFGLYFAVTNIRFSLRLKRSRIPLSEYECKLPVYLVKWLPAPCMTGLLHPAIYVNDRIYELEHPEHVILHEYTHYRHKDMLWMLIQTIILCVHWFNPLVWISSYLFRKDCEFACDEAVAKTLSQEDRIAYGKTLVYFETEKRNKYIVFSATTSMSMDAKTMKKRIRIIVGDASKRFISICIVATFIVVLFAGSMFANTSNVNSNAEADGKYWNKSYVVEDSTYYYSFYPDGTLETLLTGTYTFEDTDDKDANEDSIVLTYNNLIITNGKQSASTYDRPNVLSKAENGNVLLIPSKYYYDTTGIESGEIVLDQWTTELQLIKGADGLLADYRNFQGVYYDVSSYNSKNNGIIHGYRFYLDGRFEEFWLHEYEVLNNHELILDNFTYQYLLDEYDTTLSIWVKDRDDINTIHLEKMGTTQAVEIEVQNAYVTFTETDGIKMDYSYEENGETVDVIDIVTPLYMGYEFIIKSTGFRGIENLTFDIIPSESLESYLANNMFPEKDNPFKEEFYKNYDSFYDYYGSTLEGVSTDLKADGAAAFDKRYRIGYTDESVEGKNDVLKNQTFSKEEREKLSELMNNVTFVVSTEDTEIARIQFGESGDPIVSDDQLIRIEQTDLTKDAYTTNELLVAASHIVSEFQTAEDFKNCTLIEVRFAEDNTHEYLSHGKKIVVFEVEFQAGIFSSPGLRAGNTYTYLWKLYPSNEDLNEWFTKSFGQG